MEVKSSWKREAEEAAALKAVFDKWQLLAQLAYQIVVWDTPITKKLKRTQELLSYLTPEEKQMFQITKKDEEDLRINLELIRYYDEVLSKPYSFNGTTSLTSKVLTVEEKRTYLTRPERDSHWINWDRRSLTREGKKQLIEKVIEKKVFTLYSVPVDLRDVYCRLRSFEPKSDGWKGQRERCTSFQHYEKNTNLDFGKDDPLIWRVYFCVKNSSMAPAVDSAFHDRVLEARKLIGGILQRMMKKFEGKTVYVIPKERKIP